jgi:hypothetical protein
MTDLRFTSTEIQLIAQLLNHDALSVIWDINAFYFNTPDTTYKMECFDAHPEGSDYEFDEVFFCRFEKLAERAEFDDSQPEYWFKTVATNAKISFIEVIETAHVFPEDNLISTQVNGPGITPVSLGLLICTETGVIPAFLLPSNYGFTWLEKQSLYTSDAVEEMLQCHIKTYNRKLLRARA